VTVEIGGVVFDNVKYDRESDVLYVDIGDPKRAIDWDESPEGHGLRLGPNDELIGITIVNARWLLEQDGKIVITLPNGRQLETSDLQDVLAAA
jgi:uncharacterized protein YuzE